MLVVIGMGLDARVSRGSFGSGGLGGYGFGFAFSSIQGLCTSLDALV